MGTQEEVADWLGVSRRIYIDWESGKRIPLAKHLKNIAERFDLTNEEADALYRAAAKPPPETPEIHNLRFLRNPFFTVREAQLKQLRQQLQENGSVAINQPVSVSGLGGIGKTQLALEYAYQSYRTVYQAVFWVDATNKETLQSGYGELAHLLELPERTESDPNPTGCATSVSQ